MPQPNAPQPAWELTLTFNSINLLLSAVFIVFAANKMLMHPLGAARGLEAVIEAVLQLLISFVRGVQWVLEVAGNDLGALA